LSAPFFNLGESVGALENAGVRLLHYDVMDGHFVPNLTFGPLIIRSLSNHLRSQFDVHLMVTNHREMIEWFDLPQVRSITFHVEVSDSLENDIEFIRSKEKLAGISLNPRTPVEALDPVLDKVDQILVMTVEAGLPAQSLIEATIPKVTYYRQKKEMNNYPYKIQVDGGINAHTISSVHHAGADEIVSGSAIFSSQNPVEAYEQLLSIIS